MGVKIARKIGYGLNSPRVRISDQEWIKILRGTLFMSGMGSPSSFRFPLVGLGLEENPPQETGMGTTMRFSPNEVGPGRYSPLPS
jgi:hypothetical protein